MSLPRLLALLALIPQGVTDPVPFLDLKASYPFGEQTAYEVSPVTCTGYPTTHAER